MPDGVKKGITVKVDAALHAEVTEYIREHSMTMSEFVAIALDNELHPKYDQKEGNNILKAFRSVAVSRSFLSVINLQLHCGQINHSREIS